MTPLRNARLNAGKTLATVAADVGTDKGTLSRIETGTKRAPLPLAASLARYFGTVSEIEILYPERFTAGDEGRAA